MLIQMNSTLIIKGANFFSLLEEFKKQNIFLKKVKRLSSNTLQISFKNNQKPKIIAILKQKCYTVLSQKNSSPLFLLKPFKNIAVVSGIVFGLILNIFASFFVWNINLVGDEELKEQITKTLNMNGIKKGALKSKFNPKNIAQILYQNVDGISLVSSSIKGSTIFVSYTKRTAISQDFYEKENIVAKNDGLIASILATSGTPLVKVGDYVKKGQTLITNNPDENFASGQVFAYVWKSATVEYPDKTIVWARTNKKCENHKVIFKNNVLSQTNNICSFEKSEKEEKTIYLTDKTLPIKIVYTTEYELEPIEIEQDYDANREKLISQAKTICWQQIQGNENILEEKIEENYVANIHFVTYYIKIKEKISWN